MFDNATVQAVAAIAARLNVEQAALLAVAEVEAGGKAFARVNGRNEPLIRFEGHYFDRRLSGADQKKARAAKLASPRAGGIANPNKQEDRWKLLNRAAAINANAAFESVSWGVGQVMGSHWSRLGYASVTDMVNVARSGVVGQVEIMARFIEKRGLAGALRRRDWPAFAKGYNGPAYAKNKYDTKMAAAYARWVKKLGASPAPADDGNGMLQRGDSGKYVEDLQRNLAALGYAVTADGVFGANTEAAVQAFQTKHGLVVDGKAGIRTNTAIGEALKSKETAPKIEAAKEDVKRSADEAVKEKTGFWAWVLGLFGAGSGGLSAAFSSDWQTVLAVGGVAIVALVVILLMRSRILAAFDDINARVKA